MAMDQALIISCSLSVSLLTACCALRMLVLVRRSVVGVGVVGVGVVRL
eukprot:COSAG01_NODE_8707_length_2690_cov_9.977229_2_plen_48_part_00